MSCKLSQGFEAIKDFQEFVGMKQFYSQLSKLTVSESGYGGFVSLSFRVLLSKAIVFTSICYVHMGTMVHCIIDNVRCIILCTYGNYSTLYHR